MTRLRTIFMAATIALLLLLPACRTGIFPRESAPSEPRRISGVLQGHTVLSGEVILAADVLVPAGSVLVIEEGTVVRVRPSQSTKIDPEYLSPLTEMLVRGTLEVRGSAARPVRFEPLEASAETAFAWAGIELDGAAGSMISNAHIRAAETGIYCIATSPRLENNRLQGCRYGIIAQHGSSPRILGNRIEDGEGGVFCWGASNPYLKYNRIIDNDEEGIFVDADSRPLLDRNTVTGNALGLVIHDGDLPFDGTEIVGNGRDLLITGSDAGEEAR